MSEMTPMMAQYFEIKKDYPDTILFFRLGDFYEMFFEDAKTASAVLELTLTGRACGNGEKAPMCGVPFHSSDNYIAKLVKNGYKVAICEQVEDPALAKGIVRRDVVRIVTKGSIIENEMLDENRNNYLTSVYLTDNGCGICFVDVSTGSLNLTFFENNSEIHSSIINELGVFSPSEVILNRKCAEIKSISSFISKKTDATCEVPDDAYFDFSECLAICNSHFSGEKISALGLVDQPEALISVGTAIKYLKNVQKNDLDNIREINYYSDSQYMKIGYSTKRDLEIVETMRSREKRGSLLWVLDSTGTSMGRRLLRSWLEKPLINLAQISRRHNAVDELYNDSVKLNELSSALKNIFDMERLLTRIVYETANAKDLNALKQTIAALPAVKALLSDCKSAYLVNQYKALDCLEDIYNLIDSAISEEAPFTLRDGDIIREGFNEELDSLADIKNNGKKYIAEIEAREKELTGIPKLRIGYNRVFGYYIEVTNSYKELVPETYIRKQTLSNCERYITQELKELESKVLGAQERIVKLEYEIFCQVRKSIAAEFNRISSTAAAVAVTDVLCSLANAALKNNYVRPVMVDSSALKITDGRHPVVELMLKDAPFVPNDTNMDCEANRCAIITGPNMAGKSTYMRQVALICLMAQVGSFVPARSAQLGIIGSIFTRVGASDDLATGQSTFMVEMSEVSDILRNADKNSLIILDEVGRGTSTFDGMSIARAVLEYIVDKKKIGAKTLFSTHYHELTEIENQLEGVKNYNISVKKRGEDVIFLRRIVRGCADGSYGIEVAKLADLPQSVLARARKILKYLEANRPDASSLMKSLPQKEEKEEIQLSLSDRFNNELADKLKEIDVNTLTPIEALTTLHELVAFAKSTDV